MNRTFKMACMATFTLLVVCLSSCKKDSQNNTTSGKKEFALNAFFKSVKPDKQQFSISAGQYQYVNGANGTNILFLPNSFKKKDGSILSSGTVQVVLQEMLTGPKMILGNAPTVSNGKLLISGGQFLIKAYQNGEELLINPASKPQVSLPALNTQPMLTFIGSRVASDSLAGDSTIVWSPVDSATTPVVVRQDSFGLSYNFHLDSFTYINCDYFYGSGQPLTDVQVVVPAQHVDSNTAVFMYFPTINSVARMYQYNSSTHTFNLGGSYAVPIGLAVKIVVVSTIGTQNYYEIINVPAVTSGLSVTSTPAPATLSDIQNAINSL